MSYPSGKKKEDHEGDTHYSEQKNPTPLLRHTECDGLCTFLINAFYVIKLRNLHVSHTLRLCVVYYKSKARAKESIRNGCRYNFFVSHTLRLCVVYNKSKARAKESI